MQKVQSQLLAEHVGAIIVIRAPSHAAAGVRRAAALKGAFGKIADGEEETSLALALTDEAGVAGWVRGLSFGGLFLWSLGLWGLGLWGGLDHWLAAADGCVCAEDVVRAPWQTAAGIRGAEAIELPIRQLAVDLEFACRGNANVRALGGARNVQAGLVVGAP
jgi:hypothetical protein